MSGVRDCKGQVLQNGRTGGRGRDERTSKSFSNARFPGHEGAYLAKKWESVEKNDFKVEPITEITNMREDEGNESFEPTWDPQGGLVAVRKTAKVDLPQTAEDFRNRVTLMGTCWSFVAIQQTNRKCLATLHPQLWSDYLDYLLGETVFGMGSRVGGVAISGTGPSWKVMLSYEYEMRAAAYKSVMKGEDLAVALRTSWVDPVAKERFFTTPLCWEGIETAKRRPDSQQEYPAKAPRTGSHDNSKGKGKRQDDQRERERQREQEQGRGLCGVQCGRETYLFYLQQPKPEVYGGQELQILARIRAL